MLIHGFVALHVFRPVVSPPGVIPKVLINKSGRKTGKKPARLDRAMSFSSRRCPTAFPTSYELHSPRLSPKVFAARRLALGKCCAHRRPSPDLAMAQRHASVATVTRAQLRHPSGNPLQPRFHNRKEKLLRSLRAAPQTRAESGAAGRNAVGESRRLLGQRPPLAARREISFFLQHRFSRGPSRRRPRRQFHAGKKPLRRLLRRVRRWPHLAPPRPRLVFPKGISGQQHHSHLDLLLQRRPLRHRGLARPRSAAPLQADDVSHRYPGRRPQRLRPLCVTRRPALDVHRHRPPLAGRLVSLARPPHGPLLRLSQRPPGQPPQPHARPRRRFQNLERAAMDFHARPRRPRRHPFLQPIGLHALRPHPRLSQSLRSHHPDHLGRADRERGQSPLATHALTPPPSPARSTGNLRQRRRLRRARRAHSRRRRAPLLLLRLRRPARRGRHRRKPRTKTRARLRHLPQEPPRGPADRARRLLCDVALRLPGWPVVFEFHLFRRSHRHHQTPRLRR